MYCPSSRSSPVDEAADEGGANVLTFQHKVPEIHLLQLILQFLQQTSAWFISYFILVFQVVRLCSAE
jgi:hypothetical protein